MFRRPTFASAARQAQSRCLAASGEREGAGTCYADLENGIAGVIRETYRSLCRPCRHANSLGRTLIKELFDHHAGGVPRKTLVPTMRDERQPWAAGTPGAPEPSYSRGSPGSLSQPDAAVQVR